RDRKRGAVSSTKVGFTPPASANQTHPIRCDTPTDTPASLGDIPAPTRFQNCRPTNGYRDGVITTPQLEAVAINPCDRPQKSVLVTHGRAKGLTSVNDHHDTVAAPAELHHAVEALDAAGVLQRDG